MQITTLESQFVSVERCAEYTRIAPEIIVDAPYLPPNWPSRGTIEIKGLSMRYHISRPLVLKGLCLTIPSRAKVAICGRTEKPSPRSPMNNLRFGMCDLAWWRSKPRTAGTSRRRVRPTR